MDETTARDRLSAERGRLEAELNTASADEAARREAQSDEGTAPDDFGDGGADLAQATEGEQTVVTLRGQLRAVQEAQDRLARGEHGRCAVCDREIDDERLTARPEVTTCRDHAA